MTAADDRLLITPKKQSVEWWCWLLRSWILNCQLTTAVLFFTAFAVNSYYVTAIWCVVCSIYSAVLFWYARNYRNEFADLAAILEF